MGIFKREKKQKRLKCVKLVHVTYCISKETLFYTIRTFFGSAVDTIIGALKSMTSTFPETFFNVILTL